MTPMQQVGAGAVWQFVVDAEHVIVPAPAAPAKPMTWHAYHPRYENCQHRDPKTGAFCTTGVRWRLLGGGQRILGPRNFCTKHKKELDEYADYNI